MDTFLTHRADRATVRVISVLAGAVALALAVGSVAAAISFAWAPSVTTTLLATAPAAATAPVQTAAFDSVTLTTGTLSPGARAATAAGHLAVALTAVLVGGALAWLLLAVSAGRPLPRGLSRMLLVAGFALTLGPLLGAGLLGLGSMQAAAELNPSVGGILLVGFELSAWGVAIPVTGFGVLALAFVFTHLRTLQRDTEGLV